MHVTRDSDTTFKVKSQDHQAALLTAMLACQGLQRWVWERVGRGKRLLLRCRLLGGGRRFGAHALGEWRGHTVSAVRLHLFFMRPSSLGGGRIFRRTLSVRLSVCLSVRPVIITERHVAPPSELQWHTCTFPHALRAAYRTAISAAQILVILFFSVLHCTSCTSLMILLTKQTGTGSI